MALVPWLSGSFATVILARPACLTLVSGMHNFSFVNLDTKYQCKQNELKRKQKELLILFLKDTRSNSVIFVENVKLSQKQENRTTRFPLVIDTPFYLI